MAVRSAMKSSHALLPPRDDVGGTACLPTRGNPGPWRGGVKWGKKGSPPTHCKRCGEVLGLMLLVGKCAKEGCNKTANTVVGGSGAKTHCCEHGKPIGATLDEKRKCVVPSCTAEAQFKAEGTTTRTHCGKHQHLLLLLLADTGAKPVSAATCGVGGCTKAGAQRKDEHGNTIYRCTAHAGGAKSVQNLCQGGCGRHAAYGFKGGRMQYCSRCAEPEMLDLKRRLCEVSGCSRYAYSGAVDLGNRCLACVAKHDASLLTRTGASAPEILMTLALQSLLTSGIIFDYRLEEPFRSVKLIGPPTTGKTTSDMRLDALVTIDSGRKLVLKMDGGYHFAPVPTRKTHPETAFINRVLYDLSKNQAALERGMSVVRVGCGTGAPLKMEVLRATLLPVLHEVASGAEPQVYTINRRDYDEQRIRFLHLAPSRGIALSSAALGALQGRDKVTGAWPRLPTDAGGLGRRLPDTITRFTASSPVKAPLAAASGNDSKRARVG
jgi:hypothetical protein